MRVAYLVSQYPATSHTFIRREVAALRALDMSIDTFSVRPPSPGELLDDENYSEALQTFTLLTRPLSDFLRAHVTELARRPALYLRTFVYALRHRTPGLRAAALAIAHFGEAILLASELRKRRINHLHNHFANAGATVGLLASRQARIPWSFTIHGISEFDFPAGLLLAAKIRSAQFVTCVSYFGQAQALRLVEDAMWRKLSIVRCGLELDLLPVSTGNRGAKPRFIFVGRLASEKGISGLLDALATLTTPPDLAIVGDGPLSDRLKKKCQVLGLEQSVTFLGRLPERETLTEIAHSDALVLPSFMEGLPIVLMEALALGKPVIASRVSGIPELVVDGENGLLFTPSDWQSLADCLDRMALDANLRQRLGAAGPARIAKYFDIRRSALNLRDLFRQAVQFDAMSEAPRASREPSTSGSSKRHKRAIEGAPTRE